MASAGFGKVRPKKQRASGKPYDADRKESFLGRMKSKVKDMLTPSWLYAPADAADNGSDDDDGESVGPGSGRDSGGPNADRADGSAAAAGAMPSATPGARFASAAVLPATSLATSKERALAETGPGATEERHQQRRATSAASTSAASTSAASTSAASQAMHPVLVEPRRAFGAAAAAAAATPQGGAITSSLFPSPDIRKRVRRDFFGLAEDGAPVKKQFLAGGSSSADGASTSSSLAVIPDDSDAYQRDILLMSKRSLEHHKHDLSPKESESTESELTCTASASDKPAAAVHASSSYATDGSSLNGPALQSVRPSFSITTFTSSFTSLNESTSFLNAPASGESSFYAGKTTFGGASAYRRTPLTVSIQPSTKSTLFTKRAPAPGASAVTSATAKRILDTLEKIASPAPAIARSKDGASSISQSAADTLLAFKPLPYLSRRKVQPASKLTTDLSSQSVSAAVPPLAKLPTINAAGMAGRRDAPGFGSSGALKTDLFTGHPKSLSTKAEASSVNGLEVRGSTDVTQQFGAASASGMDMKAGGKLKPSKERGRAHYTRPTASADDVEPIPFTSTLSTAFTLPAGSVKGFDILGAKSPVPVMSTLEATPSKPSTVDGSIAPAPFFFSSPVALHSSVPDTGAQKPPDIKPFTFRSPVDVDKDAAVMASSLPKAGGSERSALEGAPPSVPTAAAGLTSGVSSGAGTPSSWGGTLLAGRSLSGSWVCDACMVSNEPGSSSCCACGCRKQEAHGKAAAVAPPLPAMPAPTGGAVDIFKQPQAGWECSACLLRNSADKSKCVACNSAKATSTETAVQHGLPKTVDIFKQPAGGWECTSCLLRNTSDKGVCAACGTRRPSAEASTAAVAQQPAPVPVDIFKQAATGWECGACLLRNSSESTKCVACGSAKAGSAAAQPQQTPSPAVDIFKQSAAGWECATCMLRNSNDKAKCAACNSARQISSGAPTSSVSGTASSVAAAGNPGNGFADIFKVPSGSWSCTDCFVQNKPDVPQCVACGGRKPGISGSAIQSKPPAADAPVLSLGSSQAVSSDQNKAATAIKFGGASSGGSVFGITFKALPTVPKFGGELSLPAAASSSSPATSSADKDVQSGSATTGNALASGPKLPAFTSFGAMPSIAGFGASSLTGPGPAKEAEKKPLGQTVEDLPKAAPGDAQVGSFKSTPAFGVQPALSATPFSGFTKPVEESPSSAKPFSIGGSSDNAAGFAAPSSFLFGSAKQPSINFGQPVKEEAKDFASGTQQLGPSAKAMSAFGGLQSSATVVPQAALKLEEPVSTATKPFVFGAGAPLGGGGPSVIAPGASCGLPSEVVQKPQSSVFGNPVHQPSSSAATAVTPGTTFVFGGPPQAGGLSSQPTAGFTFGAAQGQPKAQSADSATTFKFGSTASQPQGSSDVAPKNPAAVFGSASAQLQGNSATSRAPLIFGSTSLQNSAPLTAPTGAFSFGGATAQSAAANSSMGGFGLQPAAQSSGFNFAKAAALPPAGAASGLFQFGGSQKTEPDRGSGSFAFGSGVTAASSVSIPVFGGSAPAQPGEDAGTSSSEPNPFAPSQGLAGRTIRKIPRKFSK